MTRRVLAATLAAVVVSAGTLFGTTASAAAIPLPTIPTDTCSTVPAPAPPKHGLSGHMTATPAQLPPPDADPFAAGSPHGIHEVYGTSWTWGLYNCELVPDPATDGVAAFNNWMANFILDLAESGVAVLWTLERLAKETGIGWFGEWVAEAAKAITPLVFGSPGRIGLFSLAVGVMFLVILFRFKRMDFAQIMRSMGVLAVCVCLAVVTLAAPVEASRAVDSVARSAAQLGGSVAGTSLTDTINREAVYTSWLAGQFGDANSKTAEDYGPRLVAATNYTWHEWAAVQADPEGAGKEITDGKAREYKEIAAAVEKENPSAYTTFTGRADRVGHALWAVLIGTVMGFLVLIALGMVMLGRFLMQLVVVATPIAAIAGLLPNGTGVLMKLWDFFFAGLVNVFKFTLAVGIMTALIGRVAALDPVAALVWITVATLAGLRFLKPAQSFKQLTPGLDPNRKYFKEALALAGTVGAAVGTGGGSLAATAATTAATVASKPDDDEPVQKQEKPAAAPKPEFVTPEGQSKPVRVEPKPATERWVGAAPRQNLPAPRQDPPRQQPVRAKEPVTADAAPRRAAAEVRSEPVVEKTVYRDSDVVDEGIYRPSRHAADSDDVGVLPVPAGREITPATNPILFRPSEQKAKAS